MQLYWNYSPYLCPSNSVKRRIYMGSCPPILTRAQVRSCLHSWCQEDTIVHLLVINKIRKRLRWKGTTGGLQPKYLLTAGLTPKLCQVAQGPVQANSTSPRVLLSGYVQKSEGVSSASTGNENLDLYPISISFIHSLALVIILRGER